MAEVSDKEMEKLRGKASVLSPKVDVKVNITDEQKRQVWKQAGEDTTIADVEKVELAARQNLRTITHEEAIERAVKEKYLRTVEFLQKKESDKLLASGGKYLGRDVIKTAQRWDTAARTEVDLSRAASATGKAATAIGNSAAQIGVSAARMTAAGVGHAGRGVKYVGGQLINVLPEDTAKRLAKKFDAASDRAASAWKYSTSLNDEGKKQLEAVKSAGRSAVKGVKNAHAKMQNAGGWVKGGAKLFDKHVLDRYFPTFRKWTQNMAAMTGLAAKNTAKLTGAAAVGGAVGLGAFGVKSAYSAVKQTLDGDDIDRFIILGLVFHVMQGIMSSLIWWNPLTWWTNWSVAPASAMFRVFLTFLIIQCGVSLGRGGGFLGRFLKNILPMAVIVLWIESNLYGYGWVGITTGLGIANTWYMNKLLWPSFILYGFFSALFRGIELKRWSRAIVTLWVMVWLSLLIFSTGVIGELSEKNVDITDEGRNQLTLSGQALAERIKGNPDIAEKCEVKVEKEFRRERSSGFNVDVWDYVWGQGKYEVDKESKEFKKAFEECMDEMETEITKDLALRRLEHGGGAEVFVQLKDIESPTSNTQTPQQDVFLVVQKIVHGSSNPDGMKLMAKAKINNIPVKIIPKDGSADIDEDGFVMLKVIEAAKSNNEQEKVQFKFVYPKYSKNGIGETNLDNAGEVVVDYGKIKKPKVDLTLRLSYTEMIRMPVLLASLQLYDEIKADIPIASQVSSTGYDRAFAELKLAAVPKLAELFPNNLHEGTRSDYNGGLVAGISSNDLVLWTKPGDTINLELKARNTGRSSKWSKELEKALKPEKLGGNIAKIGTITMEIESKSGTPLIPAPDGTCNFIGRKSSSWDASEQIEKLQKIKKGDIKLMHSCQLIVTPEAFESGSDIVLSGGAINPTWLNFRAEDFTYDYKLEKILDKDDLKGSFEPNEPEANNDVNPDLVNIAEAKPEVVDSEELQV